MTRGRVLFLDVRNDRTTVTLFSSDKPLGKRVTVDGGRIGAALTKAGKSLGLLRAKPSCVVVAMGGSREVRNASWSAVRAGVAAGNALAFAWGVPSTIAEVKGDETLAEVAALVMAAAKAAKKGSRTLPAYDGEPTITTPKK